MEKERLEKRMVRQAEESHMEEGQTGTRKEEVRERKEELPIGWKNVSGFGSWSDCVVPPELIEVFVETEVSSKHKVNAQRRNQTVVK